MSDAGESIFPWGQTAHEFKAIGDAGRALVGHSIKRVTYVVPSEKRAGDQAPMHLAGFDLVSPNGLGVEFETEDGQHFSALMISEGGMTGLSLTPGAAERRLPHRSLERRDVSDSSEWTSRIGRNVNDAYPVWQLAGDNRAAVWMIYLSFEDAPTVALALASVEFDPIAALAASQSSVAAIFDETIAHPFQSVNSKVVERPAPALPWVITAQEREAIFAAANELVGETISDVRYFVPDVSDVSSFAAPIHYEHFDWISPVGMGIEFETASGRLFSAVWILEQNACGVSIGRGSVAERRDHTGLLPVTVTDTDSWRSRIGSKITGVDLHWGRVDTEGRDTVWSVRLSLSGLNAVEIALAAVNEFGELEPSADDLVVIFDEQVALTQRRRDDATSAHWKRVSHQPFKALNWIRWRIKWLHIIRQSR